MRCFIHSQIEAIAVCKRCGKAMCPNCSAYGGHAGICPECKREEYEQELSEKYNTRAKYKNQMVSWSVVAVIMGIIAIIGIILGIQKSSFPFVFAAIGGIMLIVGIVKALLARNNANSLNERILFLEHEIQKLLNALNKRGIAQI